MSHESRANRIFLSHSTGDADIVRQYHGLLKAAGLNPWMYQHDQVPGEVIKIGITDALSTAAAAIFFISPRFQDRGLIAYELDKALRQQERRGAGFKIIPLVIPGSGDAVTIPARLQMLSPLRPQAITEGIELLIDAVPSYTRKTHRSSPLAHVVPPETRQFALVGQNLASLLGMTPEEGDTFARDLNGVVEREALTAVYLMMMTPEALSAVYRPAFEHLRSITVKRLETLSARVTSSKVRVVFHPAATLSMLAVDWSYPDVAFALATVKLLNTQSIHGRLRVPLIGADFDAAAFARMLDEATVTTTLADAAPTLLRLLDDVDRRSRCSRVTGVLLALMRPMARR